MEVATLILAGGQSRRMGQDKALLMVEGVPLLRRVYDIAQGCTGAVQVVTPWPERYTDILPPDCCWLIEPRPRQGPLLAFQQALAQVRADWILLLACDLPYLDKVIIQQWLLDLEHLPEEAIAYLAPQAKGWEVLCGCYRRSKCRPSLQHFIQSGGQSFQAWLQGENVVPILATHSVMFTNWNRPADIQSK